MAGVDACAPPRRRARSRVAGSLADNLGRWGMSFGDILRAKVYARRKKASTVEATATTLRDQAFDRHRDIYDAVVGMAGRLAQDPIFAAGFGTMPNAEFNHEIDGLGEDIRIDVQGPVGSLSVIIDEQPATSLRPAQTLLRLRIKPAHDLCGALGCGWTYAEATPVTGTTADVSGFIVAVEDLLAEFLADVVVSPVAAKFLPDLPPSDVA